MNGTTPQRAPGVGTSRNSRLILIIGALSVLVVLLQASMRTVLFGDVPRGQYHGVTRRPRRWRDVLRDEDMDREMHGAELAAERDMIEADAAEGVEHDLPVFHDRLVPTQNPGRKERRAQFEGFAASNVRRVRGSAGALPHDVRFARAISDEEAKRCGVYAKAEDVMPRGSNTSVSVQLDVHALAPWEHGRGFKPAADSAAASALIACYANGATCRTLTTQQSLPLSVVDTSNAAIVAIDRLHALHQSGIEFFDLGASLGGVAIAVWQHGIAARVTATDPFPLNARLMRMSECLNKADRHMTIACVMPTSTLEEDTCAVRSSVDMTAMSQAGPLALNEANMSDVFCPAEGGSAAGKAAERAPRPGEWVYDVPGMSLEHVFAKYRSSDTLGPIVLRVDMGRGAGASHVLRGAVDRRVAFGPGSNTRPQLILVELHAPHARHHHPQPDDAGAQHDEDEAEEAGELDFIESLLSAQYIGYAHHVQTFFILSEDRTTFNADYHKFVEWRETNLRTNIRRGRASEAIAFAADGTLFVHPQQSECLWNPTVLSYPRDSERLVEDIDLSNHDGSLPALTTVPLGRGSAVACPAATDASCDEVIATGELKTHGYATELEYAFREYARAFPSATEQADPRAEPRPGTTPPLRLLDVGGALAFNALHVGRTGHKVVTLQPTARAAHLAKATACLNGLREDRFAVKHTVVGAGEPCRAYQSVRDATGFALACGDAPAPTAAVPLSGDDASSGSYAEMWAGLSESVDDVLHIPDAAHDESAAPTSPLERPEHATYVVSLAYASTAVMRGMKRLLNDPIRQPPLFFTNVYSAGDVAVLGAALYPAGYQAFDAVNGVYLRSESELGAYWEVADAANTERRATSRPHALQLRWVLPNYTFMLQHAAGRKPCVHPTEAVPSIRVVHAHHRTVPVACYSARDEPCRILASHGTASAHAPSTDDATSVAVHAARILRVDAKTPNAWVAAKQAVALEKLRGAQKTDEDRRRDEAVVAQMASGLARDTLLLDVNARVGATTFSMLAEPQTSVKAFEVDPGNLDLLNISLCLNGAKSHAASRVEIVPAALSSKARSGCTLLGKKRSRSETVLECDGVALSPQLDRGDFAEARLGVNATTLDTVALSWLQQHSGNASAPAIVLKVTAVDGQEADILQGAAALLAPAATANAVRPVSLVITEVERRPSFAQSLAPLMFGNKFFGYIPAMRMHLLEAVHATQFVAMMHATRPTLVLWYVTADSDRQAAPTAPIDGASILPPRATPRCVHPTPFVDAVYVAEVRPGVQIVCPVTPGLGGAQCLPVDHQIAERVGNVMREGASKADTLFIDVEPRDGGSTAFDVANQGAGVAVIHWHPTHVDTARMARCVRVAPPMTDSAQLPRILSDEVRSNIIVTHARLGATDDDSPCAVVRRDPAAHDGTARHPQQADFTLQCSENTTDAAATPALGKRERLVDGAAVPRTTLSSVVKRWRAQHQHAVYAVRLRLSDDRAAVILDGAAELLASPERPLFIVGDLSCDAGRLRRTVHSLTRHGYMAIAPGDAPLFSAAGASDYCDARTKEMARLRTMSRNLGIPAADAKAAGDLLSRFEADVKWYFAPPSKLSAILGYGEDKARQIEDARIAACKVLCVHNGNDAGGSDKKAPGFCTCAGAELVHDAQQQSRAAKIEGHAVVDAVTTTEAAASTLAAAAKDDAAATVAEAGPKP